MARKVRLEYPGAIYHVINRGNYRAWVFETESAKNAFEDCLFDACARSEWRLHAFVIMGNHFHLALETPNGNLSAGMHWLQATFANRFNRFRGEQGHLFQGRYKAIMVEAGEHLAKLCHYIHLNPARAGIVEVGRLSDYRHSSYWYYTNKRPACLDLSTALIGAGQFNDNQQGWGEYNKYLIWQNEEGSVGKNAAYESMSRGWVLGGREFNQALLKDEAATVDIRAWESLGALEFRRAGWENLLTTVMKFIPEEEKVTSITKSAPWKVAVADWMKARSEVTNAWLAEKLNMSSGVYVSKHIGLMNSGAHPRATAWSNRLNKVKGKT